jgi:YesN/AraC family two-component response regulator
MSKVEYVGPRVEISNHGITYRYAKEDKYIYLAAALEILKNIDNDYNKKPFYSHTCKNTPLKETNVDKLLKPYEETIEDCITEECKKYQQKILHEIEYVGQIPHLSNIDKEIWIKNIEIMKNYRVQRAINKMYYMHTIQDIVHVIQHKKIKEITAPFNKTFFHVLNTLKGALITGKPSFDAKVTEEYTRDNQIVLKLSI